MRENVAIVATFGFNGYITSFARLPHCGNCAATVAIMKGYYYMKTTTKESCKDCKYFKKGVCVHPYSENCNYCELWTPEWFEPYDEKDVIL
jgi:hypothetical protein